MQNLFEDYHFKLKLFSFLALLIIIFYRSPIWLNSRFVSDKVCFLELFLKAQFMVYFKYFGSEIFQSMGKYWVSFSFNSSYRIRSICNCLFVSVFKIFIIYYILNSSSSLLLIYIIKLYFIFSYFILLLFLKFG